VDLLKKQLTLKTLIQFVKLQLAGNILFWGTYAGYYLFDSVLHWQNLVALVVASLIAHVAFFIVDSKWVFHEKRKTARNAIEARRFIIFMGLNFFINLGIIAGLDYYFGISPYIGQFVSAAFFTLWTFGGLKYWVFHRPLRAKKRRAH
jgi:putative flippase GtrA